MLFCKPERNWIWYSTFWWAYMEECFSSELYTFFHISCKYMKYIFQKRIK